MIVDGFQNKRILVVGDVMLDHFVRGTVERVSPEAPALILHVQSDYWAVGGAGNVATNVAALGGVACLVGLVGEDDAAHRIDVLFDRDARLENHLLSHPQWPTIEKTRFIAGDSHLLRADRESLAVPAEVEALIVAQIGDVASSCDAIIISDYAKGIVTPLLIAAAVRAGEAMGIPVIADPKRANFADYRGCTVLTPNRKELSAATGFSTNCDEEVEAAVPTAMMQFGGPIVLTRSEQGLSVFQTGGQHIHDPAQNRELRDVSGAGDTVAAVLALALAAGAELTAAALAANVAAGIVVGKSGTAWVTAAELMAAMLHKADSAVLHHKLAPLPTAVAVREDWARHGLVVGFTNGCFDIIHCGHINLLRKARERCDRLIVALNTDASVQRLKGPMRPMQPESARAEVIAALEAVDMVLLFDEDTPLALIEALKPDLLLKGSDYTVETIVGRDTVEAHGGRVEFVELVEGYSTTRIIERSRRLTEA